MSEQISQPRCRGPRADACRNRDLILNVAREAFAQEGANVSLDEIVKRSGLGVGTLYRHFPTRDALIEAVYLSEVKKLATAEHELTQSLPPLEALRQWLLLFVGLLATKCAMREALNAMVGDTTELYATSGELLRAAISTLAERAVASGEIRLDIEPLDLIRALAGVANTSSGPNWEDNARKFVDVLITGVRAPTA